MLRVKVLGELELERDGQPIEPPRRGPARSLLGWLALHPGPQARATVAARLWPDVRDESARASLRTSLSALRAAIGGDALVATRTQVGLAAERVWVDAREFERLRAAGEVDDALALCRGELLSGLDEDWVLLARDVHTDAHGRLLAELAEAAAGRGDRDGAVGLARRRAALDPLDEGAHRDLMIRLAQAGDRAGALTIHERFTDRLRRQLGVAVSPATRELAADLRAGSLPGPLQPVAPPRREPPRLHAVRRRGRMADRREELSRLRAAWERASRDGRVLVVVTGEPGIGKSRLVAEFAAEHSDAAVLYGRAEQDALVPYQPVVECLRDAVGQSHASSDGIAELAGLLPELGPRPAGVNMEGLTSAPDARMRLFTAVGATLDAFAGRRPLLLILDDLQWADNPTGRLLAHLAVRPDGAPRMIVASYRDTDMPADHPLAVRLADLGREVLVERITLEGLSRAAVAEMLTRARIPSADMAAAEVLHARSGGNPFYLEQLLEHPGGAAEGIAELIVGRVRALGEPSLRMLEMAAVAGREFELSVVAEARGAALDDALDAIDAAVRGRLVAEVPSDSTLFAFVHDLVRETLAGRLTAMRRARLHARLAAVLERRAEQDPDRYLAPLAVHALDAAAAGAHVERAAELAERAAARAGEVLAYEDAAVLLRRSLTALERYGAPAARRAQAACSLGEVLMRAGQRDDAQPVFAKARALARTAHDADLLARVALAASGPGVTILGADRRTVSELEGALDALGSDNPGLRARVLARLAVELAYDSDASRREAAVHEAATLARGAGDLAALAAALNAHHVVLWGPDHTEQRLDLAGEMLDLASRAGSDELALQARNWRIVDLLELGDGATVRDEIDDYAMLCADARLPAYAWYVPLWRATVALIDGRMTDGIAFARRARDLGRTVGDANAEVFFAEQQLLRLHVQARMADVDPAAMGVQDIVSDRTERGPAWRAYRLTFAWVHAQRGEPAEARRHYDAALADGLEGIPRDVNWLAALASAAYAAILLGDADRIRGARAMLAPYADRMVVAARGAFHGGSVAYVLGRLAAACDDVVAAAALFEDAAARDARAGATAYVKRDRRARHRFPHFAVDTGVSQGFTGASCPGLPPSA